MEKMRRTVQGQNPGTDIAHPKPLLIPRRIILMVSIMGHDLDDVCNHVVVTDRDSLRKNNARKKRKSGGVKTREVRSVPLVSQLSRLKNTKRPSTSSPRRPSG